MGESWTVDGPRVIEVGGPQEPVREVRVRLIGGRVDVVAREDVEGTGTVEVSSVRGRPIEVRWSGGVLEVAHPQLTWDSFFEKVRAFAGRREDAVEVSIAVPREVAVSLGTVSAEGLLAGSAGSAEVKTVSGTLVLDGVTGEVQARTVSGQIDVRDHEGPFHGESVSGSLTVQGGSIPRLHGKTVSGEIGVDLRFPPSTLDVTTVSGDVTVRVPEGTGFDLSAQSVSGRVVAGGSRLDGGPGRVKGRLSGGDGAVRLHAKTVSGDVTLVLAGPA